MVNYENLVLYESTAKLQNKHSYNYLHDFKLQNTSGELANVPCFFNIKYLGNFGTNI